MRAPDGRWTVDVRAPLDGFVATTGFLFVLAVLLRLPPAAPAAAAACALAAPLVVLVAACLGDARAPAWAGALVALSPIHVLASRGGTPDALLMTSLLVALALWAALERHSRPALAVALGLPIGGLLVSGVPGFVLAALLPSACLATRRDRRAAAGLATLAAVAVAGAAAAMGLARPPFDYGPDAAATPRASAAGIVRCAGASFTRVVGIEYQLVVPQARYALPLLALFAALMVLGARRAPRRAAALAVAGTLLPFALGAVAAVATRHVAPLQAHRQLASLPFAALLLAAGLASLRWRGAWAAGTLVVASQLAFLGLILLTE